MHLWIIFLILFASGFVQGFIGFGCAIASLAILPYFMDIREANVLITFCYVVPVGLFAFHIRKHLNLRLYLISLSGAISGLPIGLYCFGNMNSPWIIRLTGFVILLVALDGLVKVNISKPKNKKRETIWGIIAGLSTGFLSGAVGIAGPPMVAFASRQNWTHVEVKAYIFALSVIITLSRAVGMIYMDIADVQLVKWAVYSIPFIILGLMIGEYYSRKVNLLLIRKLTFILLIAVAISMLK